jgi:hypothetical protein
VPRWPERLDQMERLAGQVLPQLGSR